MVIIPNTWLQNYKLRKNKKHTTYIKDIEDTIHKTIKLHKIDFIVSQ